jgi:hypothetical protein
MCRNAAMRSRGSVSGPPQWRQVLAIARRCMARGSERSSRRPPGANDGPRKFSAGAAKIAGEWAVDVVVDVNAGLKALVDPDALTASSRTS